MTPSEFLNFAADFVPKIMNIRVLRDTSPNRYMLLILFREQDHANEFYVTYNGKSFTSIAPEVCHTVFVRQVDIVPKKSEIFPPSGHTELPNCTICLEKLDPAVSGLLTILCNHSFHCDCLSRWKGENICPICRYAQTPGGESSTCSDCGIEENLWMCLICGYVGCSRYKNKHSEEHFHKTKHTYAMELDSLRVWDYTRDQYVHRVATNFSDNKIVEVPDFNWEVELANTIKQKDLGLDKGEALQLEWQYLLEAQLETQKRFFEERISYIEKKTQSKIKFLEQEYAELFEQKTDTGRRMLEIEKQKKALEKRTVDLEKKMHEVAKETDFLKDINDAMERNQTAWKNKIQETEEQLKVAQIETDKDEKIRDLEEQVRDLMFFIEAQKELAKKSEFTDGEIVVVPSPSLQTKSMTPPTVRGKVQRGRGRKKK
jgi:BRCA1-associated protein